MPSSSRRTPSLLAVCLVTGLVGCAGGGALDRPSETAVQRSALGEQRCVAEGDEQRLFVVDWDATDLASFQARAGRDLVVVRYDRCRVTMLHGCSDDGIAGRFGSYRKPVETSGGLETLSVRSDEELYAKLPLGAATFGGEVARGKGLDLTYFVSGVVDATRDRVHRADLEAEERCAGATHFVSSYALGAFSLASVDEAAVGASAGVAGLGGGGRSTSRAQQLKKAGDIAVCTSLDPHACRVPVRLTLRPISDARAAGSAPAPATAGAASTFTGGGMPTGAEATPVGIVNAVKLHHEAEQKLIAGDGAGCLADLDRAASAERSLVDARTNLLRARCEMRAGRCEEGKRHYREAKAAWARQMNAAGAVTHATDASVAAEADQVALQLCPDAASGGLPRGQALLGALQGIQRAAAAKDGAACVEHGLALERALAANAADPMATAAAGALRTASVCAGDAGRCAEARELWAAFSRAFTPGADAAFVASGFRENVKGCPDP